MLAEPRIDDLEPAFEWPPRSPEQTLLVVDAVFPPTRRRLLDLMRARGSASLDEISERSRIPIGSLCHNLRELYRVGVCYPDPDHVDAQGRHWWQCREDHIALSNSDFPVGSVGRGRVDQAVQASLRYQHKTISDFLRYEPADSDWHGVCSIAEFTTETTEEEFADLIVQIRGVVSGWITQHRAKLADERSSLAPQERPERRAIRMTNWVHPFD